MNSGVITLKRRCHDDAQLGSVVPGVGKSPLIGGDFLPQKIRLPKSHGLIGHGRAFLSRPWNEFKLIE
jgi:hypothetical protein